MSSRFNELRRQDLDVGLGGRIGSNRKNVIEVSEHHPLDERYSADGNFKSRRSKPDSGSIINSELRIIDFTAN